MICDVCGTQETPNRDHIYNEELKLKSEKELKEIDKK
jgi:hypothetical protein